MDSTALTKGTHDIIRYLNLRRRFQGTYPDANIPPRSRTICKEHGATSSSLGTIVINVKPGKMVPNSAAPSLVSGKRTAQAHPAQAAYSINHAKFMVPLEGRPSTPIENVGSSKQNGRSHTGNNEGRFPTTKDQSNMANSKEDPPQKYGRSSPITSTVRTTSTTAI